ncbi:MAG: ribonuclease HIII [Ignavibacteriaceae bacterium]|nr:ribonuclease HIII [Ignavibacteriaceae bacterium]
MPNTIENSAKEIISKHHSIFFAMRCNLSAIQKLNYHYEFSIIKGKEKVKVQVYFGKKGVKTIVQGNQNSSLYKMAYNKISDDLFPLVDEELNEPDEYIGTDESGKGDYFGPLVAAGVLVSGKAIQHLKQLGVKDSKELSDFQIKKISQEIKKCEGIQFNVISISPRKYNDLHSRTGNVNRILGWAHAKVIENLLEKNSVDQAISDKFGDEKFIYSSLQEHGKNITLHQITKAERYTAVAAASILARDRFNSWFKHENAKLGIELPKGASESTEVAAKSLISKIGKHSLKDFVKLHFKNTQRLNINI